MSDIQWNTLVKQLVENRFDKGQSIYTDTFSYEDFLLHLALHLSPFDKTGDSAIKNVVGRKFVIIFESDQEAYEHYKNLKNSFISQHFECLYLSSPDDQIYLSEIPIELDWIKRFETLFNLSNNHLDDSFLITSLSSFYYKWPNVEFFKENSFKINIGDIIPPNELAEKLVKFGHRSYPSIEVPSSFCKKAQVVDIYSTSKGPIRMTYYDDMVEKIVSVDPDTQMSKKDSNLDEVIIYSMPHVFTQKKYVNQLRNNFVTPPTTHRLKWSERNELFEKLANSILPDDYTSFISQFFENHSRLDEFLTNYNFSFFLSPSKGIESFNHFANHMKENYIAVSIDKDSRSILPPFENYFYKDLLTPSSKLILTHDPDNSYADQLTLPPSITGENLNKIELIDFLNFQMTKLTGPVTKASKALKTIDYLLTHDLLPGRILFCYLHHYHLDFFKKQIAERSAFQSRSLSVKIEYIQLDVNSSYLLKTHNILVLSSTDLYGKQIKTFKNKKTQNADLFSDLFATLNEGDFVVHRDHGIGKFVGLSTLTLNGKEGDFVVIEYQNEDKIYLPSYKLDLIQKHSDSFSQTKIDNLRSQKFLAAKNRAKDAIKKLAFDLLELQAKRQIEKPFRYSEVDDTYLDFEKEFPYVATKDQLKAVEDILSDMQGPKPMDRLVCGDVGFGKTEVAMRAAFKAVTDHKQVLILVPTTLLALQHFNSFQKRFANFPVNIDYLSRFRTKKEEKEIIDNLINHKIDILIGTHKILNSNVICHDLGLIIVDEEQRFGVAHKEQLKLLKASVDFLTLTATPIPRTLQLSFMGLKDLSLIQSAPPNRQSIKTYLIKNDEHAIKEAITREVEREGQVYFVHNKVQNIDIVLSHLIDLLPGVNIDYAHGQMSERELEKKMKLFYEGKIQVLVCTTIIESGIDVAKANTMIINRCDTFGLAQLHQLRGRIGRSDRKAYAYLVLPTNKKLTPLSQKRIEAITKYTSMGSGFSIASQDLEIRGSGDILGPVQSGHINSIGLELYLELLEDAINEIKGLDNSKLTQIEFNLPQTGMIPKDYIPHPSKRLLYYKKLSNVKSLETLHQLLNELSDIYGQIPLELNHLVEVIKLKLLLRPTGINYLGLHGSELKIKFDHEYLVRNPKIQTKVIELFTSRPKVYKISPDYSVIYRPTKLIQHGEILDFCHMIAQYIVP